MKREMTCTGIEQELADAWENDEFHVFLQPQIGVQSGKIDGFEALIRWEHPTRGVLMPQQFLPALRALSMVERLDYLVFEKVCAFQRERLCQKKELFCISCNFVREHFEKEHFVRSLEEIRLNAGVPAEYLAIEITEGAAFSDGTRVQANVAGMKALGYPVYLDDYGADQSTFGDLMFHSISHIKLDKKLVDHMEQENVRILIQGLCGIAHRLSYHVVCEGVETQRQFEVAKTCGVDIIQGFYFYHPMEIGHAASLFDRMR